MSLKNWMTDREIEPSEGLCVVVGTDGLNLGRNKVLSVSFKNSEEAETIYIRGGNPEKVIHITGVDNARYNAMSMSKTRASEIMMEWAIEAPFLVSYSAQRFMMPWLCSRFPEVFSIKPFLDVVSIVKCQDQGLLLPGDVDTIEDLSFWLEHNASLAKSAGYKFEEVCARFGVDSNSDMPELENKVHKLRYLYNQLVAV